MSYDEIKGFQNLSRVQDKSEVKNKNKVLN